MVEEMKRHGQPANESSRINQYLWILQSNWDRVRNLKDYRTPQATRSYSRVFIVLLPWFYGPYYCYLAGRNNNGQTSLPFALLFSVMTQVVLVGLFNTQQDLEDPFILTSGIDDMDIAREFSEVRRQLQFINDDTATWDSPLPMDGFRTGQHPKLDANTLEHLGIPKPDRE